MLIRGVDPFATTTLICSRREVEVFCPLVLGALVDCCDRGHSFDFLSVASPEDEGRSEISYIRKDGRLFLLGCTQPLQL